MSDTTTMMQRRARLLGPNVQTFYDEPVHLVRGEGVWVWDAGSQALSGLLQQRAPRRPLPPRVVEAICRQAGTLNTHTRYLHDGILDYVERLTGTFDGDLSHRDLDLHRVRGE